MGNRLGLSLLARADAVNKTLVTKIQTAVLLEICEILEININFVFHKSHLLAVLRNNLY